MPQLNSISIDNRFRPIGRSHARTGEKSDSGAPAAAHYTLILSRRDIAALMTPADYLEAVERGFRASAEGHVDMPPPLSIGGSGGAFHAKGAGLRLKRHYVALKLNGNFPGNPEARGLPTIQGAILLCDGETGALLAILDSIEITLGRTAAASALAARYLARPDSATLGVCGCGEQALAQILAIADILPIRRCLLYDRDGRRSAVLAETLRGAAGLEVAVVASARSAALASDVIVTCTTATTPILDAGDVRPGSFIAAVGADGPAKHEIAPELMAGAMIVVDQLEQCLAMGDLHHAVDAGAVAAGQVHADLADLVTGTRPGRTTLEEIAIFDSTGTGLQDVASAAVAFERAVAAGCGSRVALGAAVESAGA